MSDEIDEHRLAFLRGVLAAFASSGTVIHYNEIRRLCRLNQEQLGMYLGAARQPLVDASQPDFCAIVVKTEGWPGDGFAGPASQTDPIAWAAGLRKAHEYWRDRRNLDNGDFQKTYQDLPAVPGLDGGK